jgi:thiosulfate reductase / polysulfide reductase chain A
MVKDGLKMKRRSFLKMAAVTGAALGTGMSIPRFVEAGDEIIEDNEKEVFTTCAVCSAGCSMKTSVKYGRIVHVEGNPYDLAAGNPFNPKEGGRLCVKGYNAITTYYDPDRLKYPLRRTNPNKGINEDPGFERITWEEAIAEAAAKFKQYNQEFGPESMMIMTRSNDFSNRLGKAIGTPNFVAHQSTCYTTQGAAWRAMVMGNNRTFTYDMNNSKYILCFGFDGLGKAKNQHVRNMTKALTSGAKIVSLDPYKSITAQRAHRWLPIRPGYDLAFCLAMIHVIVTENLYNQEYVENFTQGIEELREHTIAQGYTPEWAAKLIDTESITADVIREIAREFAAPENQPAIAPSHKRDAAGPNYQNSYKLAQAQIALNALVGSIDRKGGIIITNNPKLPAFDDLFPLNEGLEFPEARKERIDNWETRGRYCPQIYGNFATLAHGILNEKPYPLKTAIVRGYNPLSFPDHKKIVQALSKLEFMLNCEIYPSEMSWFADIVLPEPHWFEVSALVAKSYHSIYPMISIRQPVVPALHEETKGFGSIILLLAKEMGYGDYFLDTSEGGSGDASGGKSNNKKMQALGSSWSELQKSQIGLWQPEDPTARDYKERQEFGTPSGKIEFYATMFEEDGYDPLPTWKPRREDVSEEYPFYMVISRAPMHKMTQTQNNTMALLAYPENHAVMNTAAGKALGINDGDEVYVESRGEADVERKIKIKAKLIEGIRPDTVMIYHGFGRYSNLMTNAYGRGANEGDLIPSMTFDEMKALKDPGQGACMQDFAVKIYKA